MGRIRSYQNIGYELRLHKKMLNNSRIPFLGVTYKSDIDDARENPAHLVMEHMARKGVEVLLNDPYITEVIYEHGKKWNGVWLTDELLASVDCVVFTTNHSCFDVDHIVEKVKLVVDTRNAVKRVHIY